MSRDRTDHDPTARSNLGRGGDAVVFERVLRPEDLDDVLAIEQECFSNPTTRAWYESELDRPDVCYILTVRNGAAVAGFCAFWRVVDHIHINNLAIRPPYRRQGLGRRLLARVLEEGERLGAPHATLEVRRSNVAACKLYEQAGFSTTAVRSGYYTAPIEDALILSRAGGRVPG